MDWKKLQNGSDIRGVAAAGVEGEEVNLTPEVAGVLARAFVAWLREAKSRDGHKSDCDCGCGGSGRAETDCGCGAGSAGNGSDRKR